MQQRTDAIELADGGIPEDTAVMTDDGPRAVQDLEDGDRVYALDVSSGLVKLKPVTGIDSYHYEGRLAHAEARRFDLLLHPDQRLPYRTRSIDTVRFQRARDIESLGEYYLINDWQSTPRRRVETIDVTDFIDSFEVCVSIEDHGHSFRAALPDGCDPIGRTAETGYHFGGATFKQYQATLETLGSEVYIRDSRNQWRRPYRFTADDFIRFLGWFITEGSLTERTNRDSTSISIAQETSQYRDRLASLFDRMGIAVSKSGSGFSFGSTVYARLLERLCGRSSATKHLPAFTWELCSEQQEILLEILLDGDGDDWDVFYTSSDQLARDVMRLCVEVGMKPRYMRRGDMWELYIGQVNDQLHPDTQVSWTNRVATVYQLTLTDYSVILIGRNGKFQWVGVSNVA